MHTHSTLEYKKPAYIVAFSLHWGHHITVKILTRTGEAVSKESTPAGAGEAPQSIKAVSVTVTVIGP